MPSQPSANAASGDLQGLTLRELEIEAALPLAKHGRVFRTRWLDEYFRRQSWYRPTGFDANTLSGKERERVEAVRHFIASLTQQELAQREESLRQVGQQAVRPCPQALVTGGGKGSVPERLAVQYASGELVLWDLATHDRRLVAAKGDLDGYGEPMFADEGRRLLAFVADEKHVFPLIVAWDTQTMARLPFDPDWRDMDWADYLFATRGLYATTRTPRARLWKLYGLQDGRHVLDLPAPGNRVHLNKLVVSNDLRAAVGRGVTYNAHWVWDLSAKKPLAPKPLWAGEEGVRDVDLTPDGKLIATLPQYSYSVTLLSARDRKLQRKIDLLFEPRYVRFSDDGHLILVGGEKHLVVVDVATGEILRSRGWGNQCLYRAHQRATFLRDSRHLAIAGDAGGLSIVELYGDGEVELSPEDPPLDTATARLETALLQRARGSDAWKSESSLSDLPLTLHPELLEQALSLAEVREEVKSDWWKLDPIVALIYARRGRVFRSPRWKAFVAKEPWYHPDPGYTDAKLTAVDRANLKVLSQVRQTIDHRGPRAPADPASLVATKAFPGCPTGATLRRSADERGIETYACELPSNASKTGRMPHGPAWRWLPTGRLLEQRNYENGVENGPFAVWFWTGARREDGEFTRGLRQGHHRTFYVTGIIKEDALYDHGRLHGARQRNFANGKRALEATYRNGVPNGHWTTSYDNGERAIHLTFSDGKTIGNVERFALNGQPWSAGVLHEPRNADVSELEHLDLESLPPIPPEPCREGVVGTPGAWPRSVMGPLVVASRKAFDEISMCSPVKCADGLSIVCAPDLDGNPGGEVIAVITCRVPRTVDCPGCTPPNVEYTDVGANVVFSPSTPARPIWTQRGFVSCREAGDLEGDPESKVQGYVRLPDGEVAIVTLDSATSSNDGRDQCSLTLHGLRQGKWQTLASGNSAPCDGEIQEPEEFDVY